MSDYKPPRVSKPHLSYMGVYIGWTDDFTSCRARYRAWNVWISVDPLDTVDPNFRKAVEDVIYRRVIEQSTRHRRSQFTEE